MAERLILAIDQGTTNTKALLINIDGVTVAFAEERVELRFPQPGWAESDATAIWNSAERCAVRCLDQAPSNSVAVVSVSNQRESVAAWDRSTGEPLGPLVSWQCGRGVEWCTQIRTSVPDAADLVAARTGLALDPMFSAPKLAWLLDHIPGGRRRAEAGGIAVGTVDAWLVWHLTGGSRSSEARFVTDATNASRTMLMNLASLSWDRELAARFEIPIAALPTIVPSASVLGPCRLSHPSLAPDAVVAGVAGDSHAALVGHRAFAPGDVKATFGTGTSVMVPVVGPPHADAAGAAPPAPAGLATTVAWSALPAVAARSGLAERMLAFEGNIYATGAALEWTAELLGLGTDVARLDSLASTSGDTRDVSFVPALAGLGAPHWSPRARGTITGLTRAAGPAQIARAAFDAVAHQAADLIERLADVTLLRVDGGAMQSDLLAQTVADVCDLPVERADEPQIPALGAGYLGGLTVGLWPDIDHLRELPRKTTRFEPSIEPATRDGRRSTWRQALRQAMLVDDEHR